MKSGIGMRRFRIGVLLMAVTSVLSCTFQGDGAEAAVSRTEVAGELARLSIEMGSLDQKLDAGARFALESSIGTLELEIGREVTEQERDRVQRIFRSVLAEFMTLDLWEESLVKVYAAHFSAPELEELLRFYRSSVGRKVIELDAKLSRELEGEIDRVLDPKMEEFIDRVDEELLKEFGELGGGGS